MKLLLNNMLKGLATALLVILLGGFLYVNVVKTEDVNLKLISSSYVNQIKTSTENKNEKETENATNEIIDNSLEEENLKLEVKEENKTLTENSSTSTSSKKETIKEETKEVFKEESKDVKEVETKSETTVKGKYEPNLSVLKTVEVIKTYRGKITGYGPDCVGCSGKTAYGHDARNGNIYYQDKTFGSIRIVAGDASLKFGTIVRIKGIGDDIIAVVLDRGGAVGFAASKHAYFDLLHENEQAALNFGQKTATFEILRNGF